MENRIVTDGQTTGHSIWSASIASCGKKTSRQNAFAYDQL